jgi:hypothetical protein
MAAMPASVHAWWGGVLGLVLLGNECQTVDRCWCNRCAASAQLLRWWRCLLLCTVSSCTAQPSAVPGRALTSEEADMNGHWDYALHIGRGQRG